MASFTYDMSEEFESQLAKLANLDEIAPKMINSATPLVVQSIKRHLRPHKRTGRLIDSVSALKAKKTKIGTWQGRVHFSGYENKGNDKVANNQKAIALEYGTTKQTATPFMEKSVRDVEGDVAKAMQQVYEQEVGK